LSTKKEKEISKVKSLMLIMSAAIGCMAILIVSGAAIAKPPSPEDLAVIISDYCDEVDQNVTSTLTELEEASADLQVCSDDFNDCLSGLFQRDPVKCIGDYGQCITFGENDQRQACNAFLIEFKNDTRRAKRSADRNDVEDEFLAWLNGDSPSRNECLNPALGTALVCVDQLIGE
jgi:hypothetical protein